MAGADVETMMRNQMHNTLTRQLDSATQAGDIQAARKVAQQLQELALTAVKKNGVVPFNNEDIRDCLATKAPWFGTDPRRSAKAVEFGKNMEPQRFKSAEEFADAVIKAVADEFEPAEEAEEEDTEDEDVEKKPAVRKKTDAPSSAGARAVPRRSAGPWSKLSDAPKEIADTIKASADKFTRNATKEQREKYISTALGTAYAADQRAKGKK